MATQILRPTSTDANAWSAGDHTDVDEVVVDPNVGDSVYLTATFTAGDDNDIVTLGFGTFSVSAVSNVAVKSCGQVVGSTPEVDINMGGAQGYQECTGHRVGAGPPTYATNNFPGAFTQADLDGLQVSFRADVDTKGDANYIDVVYVIITYTAPSGWGHKFIGVAGASIGKVSGVAIASIADIKGVDI